jgi:hypothetical protein
MWDYFLENGIKSVLFWGVGIICIWFAVTVLGLAPRDAFPSIEEGAWQAVFLSNNQVYFGKLEENNGKYLTLSNVYYLRTADDLQSGGALNLVKLGGELHGPKDPIYIPKESVLFWENMRADSRVVQSIVGARK